MNSILEEIPERFRTEDCICATVLLAVASPPGHTARMNDLPFTLSPEAIENIERSLAIGCIECAGLIPTLQHSMFKQGRSPDGTILWRFPGESLTVGYHKPVVVESGNFTRLELCGHTFAIHEQTLRYLAGKRIVVETVEVGVPSPADKKEVMLRAV